MGLPTLLGLRRRGWFIPYRYAATLPPTGGSPPYGAIEALFAVRHAAFEAVLDLIDAAALALEAIARREPPPGWAGPTPRFDQAWFPTLDACAAYALVRRHRPRRVVEIGSGHSTRFLAAALEEGAIVAIDPSPRADIARLPRVEVVPRTVHHADPAVFAELQAGDLLFIDSSHILMPGSDVDLLFGRVLPVLPAGTLVHIHDITLPDDYPAEWAWRNYNEQQGVIPLLLSGAWEVLFSSPYAATRLAGRVGQCVAARLPRHPQGRPTSLWLRKLR
ncbi:MAG: class I SAM-dependent methyltransferase [Alphaproteobacteria bacterium]|nr:class I SAM-dependent methyltransferase [Alphaproteobacteria bacterium]MCW5741097.1 class I SAM-dependent methyltransferase [Alphaproteobacteria bacterium]